MREFQSHWGMLSMWLALGEGALLTWVDWYANALKGYYWPCFFWSALLRGERTCEATFRPQRRLTCVR